MSEDLKAKLIQLLQSMDSSEIERLLKEEPKAVQTINNLTVVSGLWNINRVGRSFDQYIDNFKKFLQFPVKMYLYIPKELEELVWEYRSDTNTFVKVFELEDLKGNYYAPFWDKTQEIRTSEEWLNQTGEHGWLKDSPQAKNEWYNPIVQSKMFMLHDAKIGNPFDTDYFIWLDAGITNTVYENYFIQDRCLDKITEHLDTFLFLSYPYEATDEIHGFEFGAMNAYAKKKVEYVCRGGLFGGHKDYISQANAMYYSLLQQTLHDGYMGTEESIFAIMANLQPHVYKRYELDDNGLIVKFIENLLSGDVNLVEEKPRGYGVPKKIYKQDEEKTSVYVLGFNFPEQFKYLMESFEKNPEWLDKPRKILINNSDNDSSIEEYDKLCQQYGFEHIVTGENLGINRGRIYAAQHFEESDSDYYFFFEDDMNLNSKEDVGVCRNGFTKYVPNLYYLTHQIMAKEQFDFLKLSYTEVYMDNNIQVSWYNVPQEVRTQVWPEYDQLPINGLDPYAPRTYFKHIDVMSGISYASGNIYYANWPMIVNREGNRKMFLTETWEHPYEQTLMSYIYQKTLQGEINPAVLLASPINHHRIKYYEPDQRREN